MAQTLRISKGDYNITTASTANVVFSTGNVAIGTSSSAVPDTELTIFGNPQTVAYPVSGNSTTAGTDLHISGADGSVTRLTQDSFGTGTYVAFTGRNARGTAASPSQTQNGDNLTQFTARGFSNGSLQFGNISTGMVAIQAAENFTDTSRATKVVVLTTPSGSITPSTVATFEANGTATFASNVNIIGNLAVANISYINQETIVSSDVIQGNLTANAITVNLSLTTGTTLQAKGGIQNTPIGNVTPSTAIFTTESVSGNSTINALTVNNSATIGTTLNVTGNVILGGNLGVDGGTVTVFDSILDLHTYSNLAPWSYDDGKDIGVRFHYNKGSDTLAFLGLENSTNSLQFLVGATETASNVTGTFGNVQFGTLLLSNTAISANTTSGALIVTGGAGIGGNLNVGGNLVVGAAYTPASTDAAVFRGQSYSAGQTWRTLISNPSATAGTQARMDIATGTANAYGIWSITEAGSGSVSSSLSFGAGVNNGFTVNMANASPINFQQAGTTYLQVAASGNVVVTSTTASTSTTTGALVVAGGAGVAGNLNAGNLTTTGTLYGNAAPGATGMISNAVGYLGRPQNSQSTNYTLALIDQGKHIYVTANSNVTIPTNANVPFPIGSTIYIVNAGNVVSNVLIATDTMYLSNSGSTGTRTISSYGMATLVKVTSTIWYISGFGVT